MAGWRGLYRIIIIKWNEIAGELETDHPALNCIIKIIVFGKWAGAGEVSKF